MSNYWILLAILSGFGQALGWALKKKTLENTGVNNTLGLVSFLVAGITLYVLWLATSSGVIPTMSMRFLFATAVVVLLNILAAWAAYRALDKGALSRLMPLVALTSLAIVPIEYALRGIIPNLLQVVGIAIVVGGAIVFSLKEKITKDATTALGYFTITLVCYSIASPFMGVAVDESGSGLFSGAIVHLGIAVGFLLLVIVSHEGAALHTLARTSELVKVLLLMGVAGIVMALLENGPANIALESASASEVFALKRTMPFFALILGVMMFNEHITKRHIIGTVLLVLGSALIIWFR